MVRDKRHGMSEQVVQHVQLVHGMRHDRWTHGCEQLVRHVQLEQHEQLELHGRPVYGRQMHAISMVHDNRNQCHV